MQTMVLDRLSISTAETAKVTQVTTLLNLQYQDLCLRLGLNKGYDTLDVTADTATVTLPTDCVKILALRYGSRPIDPVSWQQYADLYAADQTDSLSEEGRFYYFMQSHTTIRILPIPSATVADAIDCWYLARPTSFSSGSSTPSAIPSEFHDILVEYTIYKLALSEEEIGLANSALQEALRREGSLRTWLGAFEGSDDNRLGLPAVFRR